MGLACYRQYSLLSSKKRSRYPAITILARAHFCLLEMLSSRVLSYAKCNLSCFLSYLITYLGIICVDYIFLFW